MKHADQALNARVREHAPFFVIGLWLIANSSER